MTFDRVRSAATGPGWRGWLIWGVGVAAYMLAVVNRSSLSAVGVDTVMALIEIPQSCSSEFLRSRGQVSAGSCRS